MNPEAIQQVLESGLLGVLLILSWGIIFLLYKDLKSERDSRLTDFKQVWQEDIKFRTELKNTLDIILELLKKP